MRKITMMVATAVVALLFGSCGNQKAPETPIPTVDVNIMAVQHTVKDFGAWLPFYRAHDSLQNAWGLTPFRVGRGLEDTSLVIVIDMCKDIARAKEFMTAPEVKEAMEKSGVTGPPSVDYIHVIRMDSTNITHAERVRVAHHVKDFDAWLKVYDDEGRAARASFGIVDRALGRGVDDPNMVYLVFEITDMEKAKARYASPELKKLMTDAGVDSEPQSVMYRLVN